MVTARAKKGFSLYTFRCVPPRFGLYFDNLRFRQDRQERKTGAETPGKRKGI